MSPEPIPKYIEQGALRRANAREEAAVEARRDPKSVARRIKAVAKAAGMTPKAYIDGLATDKGKLTPPDGTKPISAFWSFGVEHPDAPLNDWKQPFLSQRFIAEEWAEQRNKTTPGAAQTLETTQAGRELDDMFLWEDGVLEALGGEKAGFEAGYAKATWKQISGTYAELAEGRVVVFGQSADTRSILHQQELGSLCDNPNVGLRNIHFAYEPDQKWPEVTRAEAGTDAVRAVAQFNDPTLPRYIDPQGFATAAPEARKAQIDKIMESVAPAQAAAEAVKAPELQAPPKSVRTPLWQVGFKPPRTTTRPAPAAPAGPAAGAGHAAAPVHAPRPATGMDGPA
ncbi:MULTISPECIES: hypothetical protein [unclassified Streptomyces]|uniref:hypothetical protein n=1 Tax=unclassified Streptomyces TaxID=2593676 RepID=UPI00225310C7|nr:MULTISPECIES: hypothetical protein [unclassified Streptomyces]MCX4527020.1 hypothetical protein [Streptomyces sp. NBC_01551]MCX4542420.1 hypothetical protein [Streptomyces sp. NBC_01565]